MKKEFKGQIIKGAVYQIQNLQNEKAHISIAEQLKQRTNKCSSQLLKQKHHNRYLQGVSSKIGMSNFSTKILK